MRDQTLIMSVITFNEALNEALGDAGRRDARVIMFGEGVAPKRRGCNRSSATQSRSGSDVRACTRIEGSDAMQAAILQPGAIPEAALRSLEQAKSRMNGNDAAIR
jgi:hypothetical protein